MGTWKPRLDREKLPGQALTFAVAGFGVGLFWALGLPLPFLFGPLAACLIAALVGLPLRGTPVISQMMRTVLGVAIGASLTPAVVAMLPQMALSLLLIPVYVAIIAMIGVPFFRRVYKFDPVTAWYAAMPGGLMDMVLFGQEAGGNARSLALIHATRVVIIVAIAPILLTWLFDARLDAPIGAPATQIPPHEMVIMLFAAAFGWWAAVKVRLFGASILGPMIVAAVLSLTDIIHFRPPAEAILAAQFFIGITLGAGYVGVTLLELRRDVLAGVIFVALLSVVTVLFTEAVILTGLAPPIDAFLAFAPAGQAEMIVLAIIVGADLGYVVVHHLARVLLITTGAPMVARLLGVGKSD